MSSCRSDRPIVIGLGTGRCGTKSLATLLNLPHEGKPMPWRFHMGRYMDARDFARWNGGDVALYWLNYATAFAGYFPEARFVCLRRNKEATVRSWARELEGADRLACYVTFKDKQSDTFQIASMMPDYGDEPLETALPRYWEAYYAKAERLQERLPHFRIFEMEEVFGTEEGQRELLEFCGRTEAPNLEIHEHKPGARQRAYIKNKVHQIVYRNQHLFLNAKPGHQVVLPVPRELTDAIKEVAEL